MKFCFSSTAPRPRSTLACAALLVAASSCALACWSVSLKLLGSSCSNGWPALTCCPTSTCRRSTVPGTRNPWSLTCRAAMAPTNTPRLSADAALTVRVSTCRGGCASVVPPSLQPASRIAAQNTAATPPCQASAHNPSRHSALLIGRRRITVGAIQPCNKTGHPVVDQIMHLIVRRRRLPARHGLPALAAVDRRAQQLSRHAVLRLALNGHLQDIRCLVCSHSRHVEQGLGRHKIAEFELGTGLDQAHDGEPQTRHPRTRLTDHPVMATERGRQPGRVVVRDRLQAPRAERPIRLMRIDDEHRLI